MPLVAEPSTLVFPVRRLGEDIPTNLSLANTDPQDRAFRIRTTDPNRFSVSPKVGVIKAGDSLNIVVTMRELAVMPENPKLKDRFLVQTVVLEGGSSLAANVWEEASKVHEQKLKVLLDLPEVSLPAKPASAPLAGGAPRSQPVPVAHSVAVSGVESDGGLSSASSAMFANRGGVGRDPQQLTEAVKDLMAERDKLLEERDTLREELHKSVGALKLAKAHIDSLEAARGDDDQREGRPRSTSQQQQPIAQSHFSTLHVVAVVVLAYLLSLVFSSVGGAPECPAS